MQSLFVFVAALLFATVAQARPLVFTSLSMSADHGVSLEYSLSPESWTQVERVVRMGVGPTLVVQFEKPGYSQTTHVEILVGSKTTSVASGPWPTGLIATVSLRNTVGEFDSITSPSGKGRTVRLRVAGGTIGPIPDGKSGSSSSSSSSSGSWSTSTVPSGGAPSNSAGSTASSTGNVSSVQPADVVNAMQSLAELARQEEARRADQQLAAQRQADWEASNRREQEIRDIIDNPSHPVSHACGSAFADDGLYKKCVRKALMRNYGADEVTGCNRLDIKGHKFECVEALEDRKHVGTAVINACIDTFGTGRDGIKCIWRTVETRLDPSADVRACGMAFEDYGYASSCISRYARVTWEPASVLHACVQGFEGEEQLICAKMAGAAGNPPADRITACTSSFPDKKEALECVHITAHSTADSAPAIPVCAELFEVRGKRYECLSRLKGLRDRNPERLRACAQEESAGKRFKCMEAR